MKLKQLFNEYKIKLLGFYKKKTNTTAKSALRYLEECADYDKGITYYCPDCGYQCGAEYRFINHLSKQHGYPKDMDVTKFYKSNDVKPCTPFVEKANPEYLKYL